MTIDSQELKSVNSIANHFPNRKNNSIGVSTRVAYDYINNTHKRLLGDASVDSRYFTTPLEEALIDGTRYFIIPLADQDKDDWGLTDRLFGSSSK